MTIEEQEQIYEHYGIELYQRVSSPLHEDNNPSFSTKLIGDNIKWSDFSLGLLGRSAYDLVMEIDDVDFKGATSIIKEILADNHKAGAVHKPRQQPREKVLKVVPNDYWSEFETAYWAKRGIDIPTCEHNLILPLKLLFIDGKFICTSTKDNPKFIYYFDKYDRRGFKVYSPLDKEHKWLSYNTSLYNLENGVTKVSDNLIVFSSRKDRLVFDSLELCFDTTSTMSEGNFSGLLRELPNLKYDNIYSFFDFEFNEAGEKMAQKLYEQSGGIVEPIAPPTNVLNYLISKDIKDIDDLKVKGGDNLLREIINLCLK
jgi:hypothetical protein